MRQKRLMAVLFVTMGLFAAACGDSGDDAPVAQDDATTTTEDTSPPEFAAGSSAWVRAEEPDHEQGRGLRRRGRQAHRGGHLRRHR